MESHIIHNSSEKQSQNYVETYRNTQQLRYPSPHCQTPRYTSLNLSCWFQHRLQPQWCSCNELTFDLDNFQEILHWKITNNIEILINQWIWWFDGYEGGGEWEGVGWTNKENGKHRLICEIVMHFQTIHCMHSQATRRKAGRKIVRQWRKWSLFVVSNEYICAWEICGLGWSNLKFCKSTHRLLLSLSSSLSSSLVNAYTETIYVCNSISANVSFNLNYDKFGHT